MKVLVISLSKTYIDDASLLRNKVMWMLGNKGSSATLLTPKKSCLAVLNIDPCQTRHLCSTTYAILYIFFTLLHLSLTSVMLYHFSSNSDS